MTLRVAVIGAGMTGLTCAKRLVDAGLDVTVFDKGRGLGGRLATRRGQDGQAFDHGAQFATARTDGFIAHLAAMEAAGTVQRWTPTIAGSTKNCWYVGTPGMNGLVKPLADGIDVRLSHEIKALEKVGDAWTLATEEAQFGPYDALAVTIPPPQVRTLLVDWPEVIDKIADVDVAPCWALMLAFDQPVPSAWDAHRPETGPIAWAARNTSKPGRESGADCWVVHATPDWSQANLERDKDEVAADLSRAFNDLFEGTKPAPPTHSEAHRWRYALTTKPLGQACISTAQQTLFMGGDWALGARIEFAFQSGTAMADAILETAAT